MNKGLLMLKKYYTILILIIICTVSSALTVQNLFSAEEASFSFNIADLSPLQLKKYNEFALNLEKSSGRKLSKKEKLKLILLASTFSNTEQPSALPKKWFKLTEQSYWQQVVKADKHFFESMPLKPINLKSTEYSITISFPLKKVITGNVLISNDNQNISFTKFDNLNFKSLYDKDIANFTLSDYVQSGSTLSWKLSNIKNNLFMFYVGVIDGSKALGKVYIKGTQSMPFMVGTWYIDVKTQTTN